MLAVAPCPSHPCREPGVLDPSVPHAGPEPPSRQSPEPLVRSGEYWVELGISIAGAGALYPALLLAAGGLFAITQIVAGWVQLGTVDRIQELVIGLPVLLMTIVVALGAGFVYAGLLAIITLPIVRLILRMLDWRPRIDRLGSFCGALVATLATLPVHTLVWNGFFSGGYDVVAHRTGLAVVLGAVVCGQLGGVLGSLSETDLRTHPYEAPRRVRFGLWQLLAVTGLVSVLLTLMRLAGLLMLEMAAAMAAPLVVHLLTSGPTIWLVRRWLGWRIAKRRSRHEAALIEARST